MCLAKRFSWNYNLLRTALQAYVAAGWGPRIIIIDNSPDKRILNDRHVSHLSQHPLNSSPMLHRVAHSYDWKWLQRLQVAQYMPDLCC